MEWTSRSQGDQEEKQLRCVNKMKKKKNRYTIRSNTDQILIRTSMGQINHHTSASFKVPGICLEVSGVFPDLREFIIEFIQLNSFTFM